MRCVTSFLPRQPTSYISRPQIAFDGVSRTISGLGSSQVVRANNGFLFASPNSSFGRTHFEFYRNANFASWCARGTLPQHEFPNAPLPMGHFPWLAPT